MKTNLKYVFSISEEGWVTDSKKILDYLLSYYILTDAGQTYLFKNNLISLSKTYYEFINDPIGMASAVQSDLDRVLTNYFNIVDVKVQSKQINDSSSYALFISASCINDDNVKVELNKVTEINTSKSRNILSFNNYGVANQHFEAL
ncbi:MAG: hypothetical protein ACD_33C00030G0002 [uncultured bacterium]|nr:MAG: hypothetical protein ACD_33C00030G0002 [uncultured bacterium]